MNEFLFFLRCYTDRKKKIIREWSKNNTSPRASDSLGGAGDPLRSHPYMGDFLSHGYPAPYGVKDEPLRPDYYSAYAAYGAESKFVNSSYFSLSLLKRFKNVK